eukprot:Seg4452.3 transcript_id=Seg4452.3/GoldUCD/mRNA.D3Y31 product="hypothetical protein" protein_id=Seg4452.3/GoldUCD/D3Y31
METPPIIEGKKLLDLNKSIRVMSDLFVKFISAQADPIQPCERLEPDVHLQSPVEHRSESTVLTGLVWFGSDEPSPDLSPGQTGSKGTHLSRGKRPIGPVYGSKAKKHKADTLDFDTVSLYASDEEDDTPSLTAEVAALLTPNTDTATSSQNVDETHVLLDNLAQALENPSHSGDEIHPKLSAIINSRWGEPLAPEKLKPISAKYGRP